MLSEEERKAAHELIANFSSKTFAEMSKEASSVEFCAEMDGLAFENVFARLWLRAGLDRRARSLVTLGILIALRARDEFKIHVAIALSHGCTVEELEEVIYHSTGYAGFPAANEARRAAFDVLRAEGLI